MRKRQGRSRRSVAAAVLLGVFLAVSAAAQTNPPTGATEPAKTAATSDGVPRTKIAIIDTAAFVDEKGGITRYVAALKLLEREFIVNGELNSLRARVKALNEEIAKAKLSSAVEPKALQAKQDEVERLQREIDQKKEAEDARLRKRFDEVVGPIAREIRSALDQFAAKRGITLLLDTSRIGSAILAVNSAADVTQAFIAEYNSKNPPTTELNRR